MSPIFDPAIFDPVIFDTKLEVSPVEPPLYPELYVPYTGVVGDSKLFTQVLKQIQKSDIPTFEELLKRARKMRV